MNILRKKQENSILKVLYFLLYVLMILLIYLLYFFNVDIDRECYSIIFLIIFLLVISHNIILNKKIITLQFLFNCSYFLFFGGRFFSYFMYGESNFFDLKLMASFTATGAQELKSFLVFTYFILFFNLGTLFYKRDMYNLKLGSSIKGFHIFDTIIFMIMIIFFLLCFYEQLNVAISTFNNGYLARYEEQSSNYSLGSAIKYTIFYILFGLLLSQSEKKVIKFLSIIFYFLLALVVLASGARGIFVSSLLVGLWLLGLKYNIKIYHFLIFILGIVLLIIFGMNFTARGGIEIENSILNKIAVLLYDQGTTLGVLTYVLTIDIDIYPIWGYVSSFIPGTSFIAFLYENRVLLNHEISFPSFVNNYTNEVMYNNGHGLGWTIVLSTYIFSKSNLFIFSSISMILGIFLNYLEYIAMKNRIILGLLITIAGKLFFLTRADLATIIPLSIYYFIVISIIYVTSNMVYALKSKKYEN